MLKYTICQECLISYFILILFVIYRDEVGTWIWGYYGYLGNCTSLKAELWSIYRGLTIMMQKGVSNVEIETDSQMAKKLIKEGV
ncbi:hypothetical protein ACSBR2_002588 [Camellia fascicularis]